MTSSHALAHQSGCSTFRVLVHDRQLLGRYLSHSGHRTQYNTHSCSLFARHVWRMDGQSAAAGGDGGGLGVGVGVLTVFADKMYVCAVCLQAPAYAASAQATTWQVHHTPEGRPYYYNTASGSTQWEMPPGFAA